MKLKQAIDLDRKDNLKKYKSHLTNNYCDNFTILFPTFLLVLNTYSC